MRLSRKSDYALRAVMYFAGLPKGKLASIGEVAKAQSIPREFLAKILKDLTWGGILVSFQGVTGGYRLARPARGVTFLDVIEAMRWSRQAGFKNINMDLIFGLPHQTLDAWQESLNLALDLSPDHFSLYALTLEHGTPLRAWVDRGLVAQPDPDLAAEMYEWAANRLDAASFAQYEISNWARWDEAVGHLVCVHNLQYWRNLSYAGLGAGAHGFVGGFRTANILAPAAYIQRFRDGESQEFPRTPATLEIRKVDPYTEKQETLMMGLRLTQEGVSNKIYRARFGESILDSFSSEVNELVEAGLLEWSGEEGDRLRLTGRGRLLGNQVFRQFI